MSQYQQRSKVPAHVPADLVAPFDFRRAAQIRKDPWAYFEKQSKNQPIFYSPDLGGYWVIARADLISDVFRNSTLFSNGVVTIPAPNRPQSIPSCLDPPEHGKYRKIISKILSAHVVESLEGDIEVMAQRLLADLLPKGRCEFISEFARPLPVGLLVRMMGLPPDVAEKLIQWVRMMFHGETDEHLEGFQRTFSFIGHWLEAQLASPENIHGHILPTLIEGRVDNRPLTREEMHSMTMMLTGAGVDTLTSQLGHVAKFFAERPDQLALLQREPDLIPDAIEELLRRFGIANITRMATRDFEYHGVSFKKGDLIMLCSAIAGLDEHAFSEPMKVDLSRGDVMTRHRPFGVGAHNCAGARLARFVIRYMIEYILPKMPNLRLAKDKDVEYVSGVTVGIKELHLEFDPA